MGTASMNPVAYFRVRRDTKVSTKMGKNTDKARRLLITGCTKVVMKMIDLKVQVDMKKKKQKARLFMKVLLKMAHPTEKVRLQNRMERPKRVSGGKQVLMALVLSSKMVA